MTQEDLKLSDLAGAKPYYKDIHFDISAIMYSHIPAMYELNRILFGKDESHVDKTTQTMNGWYDINLLPYYKYRLETTPLFHEDNVISEFIGNLENYLIELTDLSIERNLKEKAGQDFDDDSDLTIIKHPVKPSDVFSEETVSKVKAQSQAASKAIAKMFATAPEPTHDAVSHPSYYDLPSGMESKDVIRAALGDEGYEIWCQGTSLKYLFRYPNKENPIMDLDKAKQYIDFILELRQEDLPNVED